jgi:hypothetical protein
VLRNFSVVRGNGYRIARGKKETTKTRTIVTLLVIAVQYVLFCTPFCTYHHGKGGCSPLTSIWRTISISKKSAFIRRRLMSKRRGHREIRKKLAAKHHSLKLGGLDVENSTQAFLKIQK